MGDGSLHLAETEGHHHVCARVGVDVRVMVVGLEVEYMWEIHQVHLAIDSEEQFVGHLRLWFLSALGVWRQQPIGKGKKERFSGHSKERGRQHCPFSISEAFACPNRQNRQREEAHAEMVCIQHF